MSAIGAGSLSKFPNQVDSFTDPTGFAATALGASVPVHTVVHETEEDAIVQLELASQVLMLRQLINLSFVAR